MISNRNVGRFRVHSIVSLIALALLAPAAMAQDLPEADAVIQKYVDAIGGEEALSSATSRVTKGVFALPDFAMTGDITTWVAPPNLYSEITLDSFGAIRRGIQDGMAWEVNPMQGASILEGARSKDMAREAAFDSYANWQEYFASAKTVREDEVEGTACYVVEFTPEEGNPMLHYFAKDSGLLLKISGTNDQGVEAGMIFEEYKEVDGIKIPHKLTSVGGQTTFAITVEEVKLNTEIPADRFDPPAEIKALQEKS